MQRARRIKALRNGIHAVLNLCSQRHFAEVYPTYNDDAKTYEHILFEIKLAAEFALEQFDKEKGL